MAEGVFTIDFQHMQQTVTSTNQLVVHISDVLGQLNKQVQADSSEWVGWAREKFDGVYADCQKIVAQMPAAIGVAAQTLQGIHDKTKEVEEYNAQRIAGAI